MHVQPAPSCLSSHPARACARPRSKRLHTPRHLDVHMHMHMHIHMHMTMTMARRRRRCRHAWRGTTCTQLRSETGISAPSTCSVPRGGCGWRACRMRSTVRRPTLAGRLYSAGPALAGPELGRCASLGARPAARHSQRARSCHGSPSHSPVVCSRPSLAKVNSLRVPLPAKLPISCGTPGRTTLPRSVT